jgi:hypothetical protein
VLLGLCRDKSNAGTSTARAADYRPGNILSDFNNRVRKFCAELVAIDDPMR